MGILQFTLSAGAKGRKQRSCICHPDRDSRSSSTIHILRFRPAAREEEGEIRVRVVALKDQKSNLTKRN
jgi:hypothetical protein